MFGNFCTFYPLNSVNEEERVWNFERVWLEFPVLCQENIRVKTMELSPT